MWRFKFSWPLVLIVGLVLVITLVNPVFLNTIAGQVGSYLMVGVALVAWSVAFFKMRR